MQTYKNGRTYSLCIGEVHEILKFLIIIEVHQINIGMITLHCYDYIYTFVAHIYQWQRVAAYARRQLVR